MPLTDQQKKELALIIQGKIEENATKNDSSTEISKSDLKKLLENENFAAISKIEFLNPTAQSLVNRQNYALEKNLKLNLLQYAVLYVKDVEIFKELINILQAKFATQPEVLKQFYEQTLPCPLRNNSNGSQYDFSVYDLAEARLVQDFSSQREKSDSEVKTMLKEHLKFLCPESFKALEEKREKSVAPQEEARPAVKALSREELQKEITDLKAQLLEKEGKIEDLTATNSLLEERYEDYLRRWEASKTASDNYKTERDIYLARVQTLEARITELGGRLTAAQAVEQNERSDSEVRGENTNTEMLAVALVGQDLAERQALEATQRLSEAEVQAQSLRWQLTSLEESNAQLNAENETLKTENAKNLARVAELEEQAHQLQKANKYAKILEAKEKALKYTIAAIALSAIGGAFILSMVPKFVKNNETLDIIAKIGVGSIGVGIVALITYLLSPSEEKINSRLDEAATEANNTSPNSRL